MRNYAWMLAAIFAVIAIEFVAQFHFRLLPPIWWLEMQMWCWELQVEFCG
jgi:hypothetical protein